MTAFLILPTTRSPGAVRRVDFADFGSLFAEVEEPAATRDAPFSARRVLSILVIVLLMLSDTVLLSRPQTAASSLFWPLRVAMAPA